MAAIHAGDVMKLSIRNWSSGLFAGCLLAAALLPVAGCGDHPAPKAKPAADTSAKPTDEGSTDKAGATEESMPADEKAADTATEADATEPGAEDTGPNKKFGEPAEIELPK
jgi:hypothetical protein